MKMTIKTQINFDNQLTHECGRVVKFVALEMINTWTLALRTNNGFLISLNSLVGHRFDKDGNFVGAIGNAVEELRKCETTEELINILIDREVVLTPIYYQAYDRKRNLIYTATTYKVDWLE